MNEENVREAARQHAAAVVAGDVETVLADLDPSLHEQVPTMVALMPEGLSSAELVSVDVGSGAASTETRYVGSTSTLVVHATWERRDDRYVITAAQPKP